MSSAIHNPLSHFKFTKVADHTTAGTSTITSASVDMRGYQGVIFMTSFGTAAADNIVKLQISSDDGSADDFSDVLGSAVALGGASDEDQVLAHYRPIKRYARLSCARGTSSTLESIWAIQYGAQNLPPTSSVVGTIATEFGAEAAEGTA